MTLRHTLRSLALAGILLYTFIRFFIVRTMFEQYGVNPWIFLIIDAVTAVSYIFAVDYLVATAVGKQKTAWRPLITWAVVAIVSFTAPYGYVFIAGSTVPSGLGTGLAIVVSLLLANAAVAIWRRARR
jgi:hypothetical protein